MDKHVSYEKVIEAKRRIRREMMYWASMSERTIGHLEETNKNIRSIILSLEEMERSGEFKSPGDLKSKAEGVERCRTLLKETQKVRHESEILNISALVLQKIDQELTKHIEKIEATHLKSPASSLSQLMRGLEENTSLCRRQCLVTDTTFRYIMKMEHDTKRMKEGIAVSDIRGETPSKRLEFTPTDICKFYTSKYGPNIRTWWLKVDAEESLYKFLCGPLDTLEKEEGEKDLFDDLEVKLIEMGEFKYVVGDLEFVYPAQPKVVWIQYLFASVLCDEYLDYRCDTIDELKEETTLDDVECWKTKGVPASDARSFAVEHKCITRYLESNPQIGSTLYPYVEIQADPSINAGNSTIALLPKIVDWRKKKDNEEEEVCISSDNQTYELYSIDNIPLPRLSDKSDPYGEGLTLGVEFANKLTGSIIEMKSLGDNIERQMDIEKIKAHDLIKEKEKPDPKGITFHELFHETNSESVRVFPRLISHNGHHLMRQSLRQPEYITRMYSMKMASEDKLKMFVHRFNTNLGKGSCGSVDVTNNPRLGIFLWGAQGAKPTKGGEEDLFMKDLEKPSIKTPLTNVPPPCLFSSNVLKLEFAPESTFVIRGSQAQKLMQSDSWNREVGKDWNQILLSSPFGISNEELESKLELEPNERNRTCNTYALFSHLFSRDSGSTLDQSSFPVSTLEFPVLSPNRHRETEKYRSFVAVRFYAIKEEYIQEAKGKMFVDLKEKCYVSEDFRRIHDTRDRIRNPETCGTVSYLEWGTSEASNYLVESFEEFFDDFFIKSDKGVHQDSKTSLESKFKAMFRGTSKDPKCSLFHELESDCREGGFPGGLSNCTKWSYVARYCLKYAATIRLLKVLHFISSTNLAEGEAPKSPIKALPMFGTGWTMRDLAKDCFLYSCNYFFAQEKILDKGLNQCCHTRCRAHKRRASLTSEEEEDGDEEQSNSKPLHHLTHGEDEKCKHLNDVKKLQEMGKHLKDMIVNFMNSSEGMGLLKSGIKPPDLNEDPLVSLNLLWGEDCTCVKLERPVPLETYNDFTITPVVTTTATTTNIAAIPEFKPTINTFTSSPFIILPTLISDTNVSPSVAHTVKSPTPVIATHFVPITRRKSAGDNPTIQCNPSHPVAPELGFDPEKKLQLTRYKSRQYGKEGMEEFREERKALGKKQRNKIEESMGFMDWKL